MESNSEQRPAQQLMEPIESGVSFELNPSEIPARPASKALNSSSIDKQRSTISSATAVTLSSTSLTLTASLPGKENSELGLSSLLSGLSNAPTFTKNHLAALVGSGKEPLDLVQTSKSHDEHSVMDEEFSSLEDAVDATINITVGLTSRSLSKSTDEQSREDGEVSGDGEMLKESNVYERAGEISPASSEPQTAEDLPSTVISTLELPLVEPDNGKSASKAPILPSSSQSLISVSAADKFQGVPVTNQTLGGPRPDIKNKVGSLCYGSLAANKGTGDLYYLDWASRLFPTL